MICHTRTLEEMRERSGKRFFGSCVAMDHYRLVAIDVMNILHQNYHGMPQAYSPPGSDGKPGFLTNAVHGVLRDVLRIRKDLRPDFLIAVLDGGSAKRRAIYPEYKAHRKPTPEDLLCQIGPICELLHLCGTATWGVEGIEADDLLASIAASATQWNIDVVLVSSDKDLRQCLREENGLNRVLIRHPRTPDPLLTAHGHYCGSGLWPSQWIDRLAIVGDPSDNVPGVAGIGEKTALDLLTKYGSWERIVAAVDQIPGDGLRKKILAGRSIYPLMRRLVELDREIPLPADWPIAWQMDTCDGEAALARCADYGVPLKNAILDDCATIEEPGILDLKRTASSPTPPLPEPKPKSKIQNPKCDDPAEQVVARHAEKEARAQAGIPLTTREVLEAVPGVSEAEAGKIRRQANRRRGTPEAVLQQGELF